MVVMHVWRMVGYACVADGGLYMYWPQLRYCFAFAKHYSEILPSHISAILREDEESKSNRYRQCRQYL